MGATATARTSAPDGARDYLFYKTPSSPAMATHMIGSKDAGGLLSGHLDPGPEADVERPRSPPEGPPPAPEPAPRGPWTVDRVLSHPLLHLAFNVAASIGIVFANKLVFVLAEFPFPVTLTLLHILATAIGMRVFARQGFFEVVELSKLQVVPVAAAYIGYVILGNMSIQWNSIGFYQISKILATPAVMLLERIFYQKTSTASIKGAVVVMCIGIALATVTDATVTTAGALIALTSVACSASYSVLIGAKQKEFGVGSMQLLHQFSPLAALMLLAALPFAEQVLPPVGPAFEGTARPSVLGWVQTRATPGAVFVVLLSAAMGLLLNWSMFVVIGSTSALTFNVMGHIKTVLVIVGGMAFFGTFPSAPEWGAPAPAGAGGADRPRDATHARAARWSRARWFASRRRHDAAEEAALDPPRRRRDRVVLLPKTGAAHGQGGAGGVGEGGGREGPRRAVGAQVARVAPLPHCSHPLHTLTIRIPNAPER